MKKQDILIVFCSFVVAISAMFVTFVKLSDQPVNTPSEAVGMRQPIVQWTSRPSILDPFTAQTEGISELDLARLVPDPYVVFTKDFAYSQLRDEANQYEFTICGLSLDDFDLYVLACRRDGWSEILEKSEAVFQSRVVSSFGTYQLEVSYEESGHMVVQVSK